LISRDFLESRFETTNTLDGFYTGS
jgi:hypothetical protein